jgi:hypothetical protein
MSGQDIGRFGASADRAGRATPLSPDGSQPSGGSSHSAEICQRCGHQNAIWFAPSPLWNAVMRGGCINGEPLHGDMVCAACFMVLAVESGVASVFRVTADVINVPLQTATPSGRVWDEQAWLWREPTDA